MSQPLRVGLIGAGTVAQYHIAAAAECPGRARFQAVADVNEAAARRRAGELSLPPGRAFADARRLIREAPVDAVLICTTHDTHAELAIDAAEAGKHVLVEKPMAISLRQCQDMIRAADRAGVTLMVGQQQRYQRSYAAIKRLAETGALGEVYAVRFDAMQHLVRYLGEGSWMCDGRRAGGGVVINLLVHRLDLMRWLVGEVSRATATCRTRLPSFVNGAEDLAAGTLEYASGAVGEFFATYSGPRAPWGESFMIFGSRAVVHAVPAVGRYVGDAHIALADGPYADWLDQYAGWRPIAPDEADGRLPSNNAFTNELLEFADCAQTGREPLTSGRDNIETMKLVFAIYESARRGHPVSLSQFDPAAPPSSATGNFPP